MFDTSWGIAKQMTFKYGIDYKSNKNDSQIMNLSPLSQGLLSSDLEK